MRNEVDLDVNANRSAFRQHKAAPVYDLQGIIDDRESWWKRILKWENLTVAGREVKGFVVPGWAAGVLLATIIGALGFMYNQNQTQREMLIRLEQKLSDKNENDREFRVEMKSKFESLMAWQEVTNKNLVKLEVLANTKQGAN